MSENIWKLKLIQEVLSTLKFVSFRFVNKMCFLSEDGVLNKKLKKLKKNVYGSIIAILE
jgi:hypothetical protein